MTEEDRQGVLAFRAWYEEIRKEIAAENKAKIANPKRKVR